jgi:DNA-directed RNA polymerase specialized sigma24 family protein
MNQSNDDKWLLVPSLLRLHGTLCNRARHLCRRPDFTEADAVDVCNRVVLSVSRNLDKYDEVIGKAKKSLHWKVIDWINQQHLEIPLPGVNPPGVKPDVEEVNERAATIRQWIARQRRPLQVLFEGKYRDGLTLKEVAAAQGWTARQVYRLHYQLKKGVGGLFPDDDREPPEQAEESDAEQENDDGDVEQEDDEGAEESDEADQ